MPMEYVRAVIYYILLGRANCEEKLGEKAAISDSDFGWQPEVNDTALNLNKLSYYKLLFTLIYIYYMFYNKAKFYSGSNFDDSQWKHYPQIMFTLIVVVTGLFKTYKLVCYPVNPNLC